MIHAPLRGMFFLGRMAFVVAAAAAVPILLKKNRKLFDQLGDSLIRAGENLKKSEATAASAPSEPATKVASKPSPARPKPAAAKSGAEPKPKVKTTARPANKPPVKKAAAKKRPARKPKPPAA